jgi:hypothetical protein
LPQFPAFESCERKKKRDLVDELKKRTPKEELKQSETELKQSTIGLSLYFKDGSSAAGLINRNTRPISHLPQEILITITARIQLIPIQSNVVYCKHGMVQRPQV